MLKRLLEERAKQAAALKALVAEAEGESRDLTDDEAGLFGDLEKEIAGLDARIARLRRVEELAAAAAASTEGDGQGEPGNENRTGRPAAEPHNVEELERQRSIAFRGWLRAQGGESPRREERNACERLGLDYGNTTVRLDLTSVEQRVQTTDVPSGGGFLVPATFVSRFDKALVQFGGLRAHAEVIRTAAGEDMMWPGADDTGNTGALLAEASGSGAAAQDISFKQQIWHAHQYTSKLIRVSRKMLRDSGVDLEGIIADMLGERIGRITATHFATGTGAGQPQGIELGSVLGVTAASATAIAADELEDLVNSVDPAYRMGAAFLMHDSTRSAIAKMKDGMGRYLFRGPNDSAESFRIFGYPVFVDQGLDQDVPASGEQSVFFGQLSAYKIRDVATIEFRRLEERYGEFNQVGFVAFSEHDGKVLNSGGNPIKHIVH